MQLSIFLHFHGLWLMSLLCSVASANVSISKEALTSKTFMFQKSAMEKTMDTGNEDDSQALVQDLLHKLRTEHSSIAPVRLMQETATATTNDYIDFSKLLDPNYVDDDPFYAMLGSLLEQGKQFINGNVTDGLLLITSLMQNLLANDDDGDDDNGLPLKFRWDIPDGGYTLELPGINPVILSAVQIGGLDTFTMVSVLNPSADDPQTIQNSVAMETLSLDLELIEMTGDNGETTDSIITLSFQDVTLSAPLVLAVSRTAMAELPVGALLYTEFLMACLNVAVDTIEMTSLDLTFGTIDTPTSSSDSPSAIFTLIQTVFVVVPATVPAFFDSILRPILNRMLQSTGEGSSVVCPNPANATTMNDDEVVDLHELFQQGLPLFMKSFIDSEFLAVDLSTGLAKINTMFIDPWTFNQSGVEGMFMLGDSSSPLVDFTSRLSIGGLQAEIQIRVPNVTVRNLNTMTDPLELLETVPNEPFLLYNTATMGLQLEDRPLSLSTSIFFSIDAKDGKIANDMDMSMSMETMNMILTALLKVTEEKMWTFPIRDVTNVNCWLAAIPAPALDARGVRLLNQEVTAGVADFSGSFGDANLNVSCLDCGSPRMKEFTDLLQTSEAQESFKTTMDNMIEDFMGPLLTDLVQLQADRMLNKAVFLCPHSPDFNPDAITDYDTLRSSQTTNLTYLMLFGIVVLSLIVITAIVVSMVKFSVGTRHRRFVSGISKDHRTRLVQAQARDDAMERELNSATKSLIQSPEIPLILRWSMPIIILGNIALFLSGHLSLGATVNIEAQVAGDVIRVDEFYEFSVAQSTIDIWDAGGKALAVLILIFSGIWPYTKQLITLVVWFLPPSVLAVSKRGSLLLWLDWLAKWSMIDIFVIIVSIASFRVSIQSPDVGFLPEDFYNIDLLVVPLWGLYSNMTAQLVSQISSHFIIHYHRKIVNAAKSSFQHRHQLAAAQGLHGMLATPSSSPLTSGEDEALRRHHFGRPHRGEEEKVVIKSWVSYLLIVLAISVTGLVIVGCILPSLTVEILGIIGVAVELGQSSQPAKTSHSVFTIVQLLIDEAKFVGTSASYTGLGILSCLFLLTVLVVPIVQSLVLLRQWFSPMTRRQRTRESILNEVLQAWQYVEVYLLSLFVACWQLGPISEFMFNTSCGQFDGFFSQMAQFGILKLEDAQCFSVQGFIEPGSILLATAAVLLAFLNTVVSKAVKQYFYDLKIELENELFEDGGVSDLSAGNGADGENTRDTPNDSSNWRLHPVPVLFTDTFRWFVTGVSQPSRPSPNTIPEGEKDKMEAILEAPEAPKEPETTTGTGTAGGDGESMEPERTISKSKFKKGKGTAASKKKKATAASKKKKAAKAEEEEANGGINNVLSEKVSM